MAEEHTGIKGLFATIRKSPALMITFGVGAVLLVFILAKRNSSSSGSGQTQSTSSTLPSQTGQGSYIQPYIEPIVIPMYGNGNAQQSTGLDGGAVAPGPTTGITMPPPSGGGSNPVTTGNASGSPGSNPATTPSNHEPYIGPVTGGGTNSPYFGLLGPRVQLLSNNKYQIPGVQGPTALPLGLQSKDLTPGDQGRVWYSDPSTGQQRLLTSGVGPAVTNSPQNGTVTQSQQGGGNTTTSSTGPTINKQNNQTQINRSTSTIPSN